MRIKNIKDNTFISVINVKTFNFCSSTLVCIFWCHFYCLFAAEYMEYELIQMHRSPMLNQMPIDIEEEIIPIRQDSENIYGNFDEENDTEESIQDTIESKIGVNSSKESILKRAGRYSVCLLGLTGGIPLFSIAERAAGHSLILGIFFGAGALIDNGVTTAWYLDNYYSYSFSDNYQKLQNRENEYSFIKNIFHRNNLKTIILTCLALLDTVPITYVAYKYNKSRIYPALEFVSEFGVKVFGYYKFFDHFVLKKDGKKQEYLTKVNIYFSRLLSTSSIDSQSENILTLYSVEENNDVNLKNLFQQIERIDPFENSESDTAKKRFITRIKILYASLFLANAIKRSTFAYRGLKTVFDSDLQSILLAIPSTISSFGVAYFSINSLIERVASYLFNQKNNHDFMSVFHPGYNACIYAASLILAFSSAYSFSYATQEILEQIYPPEITYVIVLLTIINGTLVDSFSLREGINNYLTEVYSYYGTVQERRILNIKKYLSVLHEIILNMTEYQISMFYKGVQDGSTENL